ncbi:MAG: hypothetical protein NC399_06405 [Muribaculum sp.]|nr:hypothetical protein [Muribaculum sp.]
MSETRDNLRHYFNIGTAKAPEYVLLGDGITSLTEEFNPETEQKHYIHQKDGTNNIKSYSPSISVEKEYIKGEDFQNWIDQKIKTLPTGAEAMSDYVRINIMEEGVDGVYPAVRRKCTYQFDSVGGEGGGVLVNSMTLSSAGDGKQGTFDVASKTFTAAE